ncbi:hypothetical protein [Desulfonema magnum]|uniref:Uncharacterized protein n=1 Tax=Desulfonema magnum TaxID=45655 RepID=A0A975BKN0_9BACT|nr:hypothetical protein [Desulfonema magnum]QTA87156.1 Uncharacterized protein dnm_031850 [Desulfonema magnum]
MTKKILECSLSFFLIACGISMLFVVFNAKQAFNSYLTAIEEQKQVQTKVLQSAEAVKEVCFELGILAGARSLEEQRLIEPTDANEIVSESIDNINKHSERLAKIVRQVNNKILSNRIR